MPEWKDTVNLPRTGVSDEGQPADDRARNARPVGGDGPLREDSGATRKGRTEVRAARRSAVRQRQDPPRHGAEQDPEGLRREVAFDGRVRRAVRRRATTATACPIELKVDRELGPKKREMPVADFRRACRAYAERFIGVMTDEFKRLGVLGEWDRPYITMDFTLPGGHRAGARRVRRAGAGLQGQEAGALVHPLPHGAGRSGSRVPAITRRRRSTSSSRWPSERGGRAGGARAGARRAPRLGAHLDDDALDDPVESGASRFIPSSTTPRSRSTARSSIVAEALAARVAAADGRAVRQRRSPACRARLSRACVPASAVRRATRLAVLGEYVTLEAGTGVVHTAPGHGADDFNTGVKYGLEIYAPVGPGGHFLDTVELFGGLARVRREPESRGGARRSAGRLWHRETFSHQYPHCWRCHNPVIFLATSQWFIRMDGDAAGSTCRWRAGASGSSTLAAARRGDRPRRQVDPGVGARSDRATWSRTGPTGAFRASAPGACRSRRSTASRCGEAVLTAALVERAASVFDAYGADAWYERPIEEFLPPGPDVPGVRRHARSSARRTSSTSGSTRARATRRCCPSGPI